MILYKGFNFRWETKVDKEKKKKEKKKAKINNLRIDI